MSTQAMTNLLVSYKIIQISYNTLKPKSYLVTINNKYPWVKQGKDLSIFDKQLPVLTKSHRAEDRRVATVQSSLYH